MKQIISKGARYCLISAAAILFLFPVMWIVMISLKDNTTVFTDPFTLPSPPIWQNYVDAFLKMNFFQMFGNTLFITVISIVIGHSFVVLGSFAISRMRFGSGRLQNGFASYFMMGLIVPAFILIFPIYMIVAEMGLLNTRWGIIIPYLGWAAPVNMMIFNASFKGIPMELDEAAAIDGCGSFQILIMIDLPMLKPAVMTTVILSFLGCWNEYPLSSIVISSRDLMPISLAASMFKGMYSTNYAILAAALVILIVPQIIVFALFERQIEDGVVAGAVKG